MKKFRFTSFSFTILITLLFSFVFFSCASKPAPETEVEQTIEAPSENIENVEKETSEETSTENSENNNDEYKIKSSNELCELCIVKDEELGRNDWRTIFFFKDESLLSDTFEIFDEIDLPEISRNVKGIIIAVRQKLERGRYNDFMTEEDVKNALDGLNDIKSKFKQVYNTEV